jgi:PAS domain-containing protein
VRQKSHFKIFFFSICILLGFILLAHVILISVIYTIRVSIGNEYLVLQENVLEKIYTLNKVITSANRVIAYDPRQKTWSEVMDDLWNFNSPVMGERVLTEKIRDDILVRILGDDPLHVKERRDRTLKEYEETLQEVFRLASLLRDSTADEERIAMFPQYQREMRHLLLTANQHNDELMQIESVYFSYLNQNLSRTMTLLSRLTYSLVIFALFTGALVIVFLLERRRAEMTLTHMNVNLENILKASIPLCVTSRDYGIMQANEAYAVMFGQAPEEVAGMKCYDSRPGPKCHTSDCPLQRLSKGAEETIYESKKYDITVLKSITSSLRDRLEMIAGN